MNEVFVLVQRHQLEPRWFEEEGDYELDFLGVFGSREDAFKAAQEHVKQLQNININDLRVFGVPLGKITHGITPYWD